MTTLVDVIVLCRLTSVSDPAASTIGMCSRQEALQFITKSEVILRTNGRGWRIITEKSLSPEESLVLALFYKTKT